ncbi:aminotransferase class I/II-fold pyridoxal phosphate-dependent enzyme [Holdemanella sp. MSK.7.32]|uniref:aminotransferase class I/II-fold pyridoxal phosphate-dependent enzyme n=1 Tax=Holdemanella sp. MSK.7.32 TaxID=2965273 RepID=UPI00210AD98E|nr:aminotransferase class I/II-fold pyridoxal phosphate-dependent enzyme [Holdemanella sp. MSK.7.32]MCQ4804314.1 aminotransferase class I/II-fold pyridoxal phosphate-dependent enzyme [Holdemanella sp. MSK.7.32]
MKTPIVSFLKSYQEKSPVRMHMPGHKGAGILGFEGMDLTEIYGADELFAAEGIIKESEQNASSLFGCPTYYSTQGSTLCIQTMCTILCQDAKSKGKTPKILAGRNAHRSFIHAAALLDFEIEWLYGNSDYLSCKIHAEDLEKAIIESHPTAVYLTNPDYLGNLLDIKSLASVCKKHNVLLAIDNAHGAYLRFLEPSLHPIDLGADLCCDSAHKTLPVLTGGAYLHLSESLNQVWKNNVKHFMEYFSSTSPSYLIMASLDAANEVLDTTFRNSLSECIQRVDGLKNTLTQHGYTILFGEPMKITISTKEFGYTGNEIANLLMECDIYPEFYDSDYIVLMPSPYNTKDDLKRLETCLCGIDRKPILINKPPKLEQSKKAMNVRQALFSSSITLDVSKSLGQVCSSVTVSCPPAILPVIPGEVISESSIEVMKYYGIETVRVVKE